MTIWQRLVLCAFGLEIAFGLTATIFAAISGRGPVLYFAAAMLCCFVAILILAIIDLSRIRE